jgi:hypothetical protein
MPNFKLVLIAEDGVRQCPPSIRRTNRIGFNAVNGEVMSVLAYVVVTVAVFALLGGAQRLLERL